MNKQTLFFAVSALAILAALTGCKEDAPPKDPNKRFASVAECETFYGQPCVDEVAPVQMNGKNVPVFLSKEACEAEFGLGNCRSQTLQMARKTDINSDTDLDLSDPDWQTRLKSTSPATDVLPETVMVYYPVFRSRERGSSYYYPNGGGYYRGSPMFTYFPFFIGSGGHTPGYVVGNPGRAAMGLSQTPQAGPKVSGIGTGGGHQTGTVGAGSSGSKSGISSGATGRAGGFGGTAGGSSS